jgi:gliding motility-associated-like protein
MKSAFEKTCFFVLINIVLFSPLYSQKLWECNDNLMTLVGNRLGVHTSSIDDTIIEIKDTILNLGLGSFPLYTNAIGYRKKEDAIFGIKYENNQQILFKKTIYGELTDLYFFSDNEIEFPLAGCMSLDDNHLLILTAGENTLVSIGLEDGAYTQNILSVGGLEEYALLDIAVNPMNGLIYGIAVKGGEPPEYCVATIDPLVGELLEINDFIDYESIATFPSISVTSNEMLVAYNMGLEDILVHYHIPSKTITNSIVDTLEVFHDLGGYGTDGCSCSSGTIKLQKFYSQDTIEKCKNERLTYRILNYDISSTDNSFLITDTLPKELVIEEMLFSSSDYNIDIESDSIINIWGQDGLKYGLDSIVFLVSVDESSPFMVFESQAVLYNCEDFGLDCSQVVTKSDDPKYPNEENDATLLVISDIIDGSPPQIDTIFYKCPDSVITLSLFPGMFTYEIEWIDGSLENVRSFDKVGVYPVMIRDNCNEHELNMHIIESQVNVELQTDYEVVYGTTVEISSSIDSELPLESQSWYLDTLLLTICEGGCNSVSLSTVKNQTVKTRVINQAGCADEALSILRVTAPIYFPTAFSPNQDGYNDVFYLQSEAQIPVQILEIYDRWGGQVFSMQDFNTNDEASGWDGMVKGRESEIGTYVWFALIDINGEPLQLQGEINLTK